MYVAVVGLLQVESGGRERKAKQIWRKEIWLHYAIFLLVNLCEARDVSRFLLLSPKIFEVGSHRCGQCKLYGG